MKKSASSSKDDAPLKSAQHEIRVRYGETDAMGWVYYGAYLSYFEVGRTELMRTVWTAYRTLEESGQRLPVVEAFCKYHHGAVYDDLLLISTDLFLPSSARIRFEYNLCRIVDQKLIATGYSEHCFVDPLGKPVRIPEALIARAKA